MIGMRKEKTSTTTQVKGRDTLAVKRFYSPAKHDWRRAIVEKSVELCRERRNEKLLERLGAPTTQVLEQLLAEEKEEVQLIEEEILERELIMEEQEGDEEEAYKKYNEFGLQDEWEQESEREDKVKDSNSSDSQDSDTEESEWDDIAPPLKVRGTRGKARGSTVRRRRGGKQD